MKKRLLITGANGFVGKNCISVLAGSDWDIIPIVHRSAGLKNEIIAEFSDAALFLKMLDSLPVAQAVVPLGAKIGWDGSSKRELYAANVLATGILAEWARKKVHTWFLLQQLLSVV